MNITLKDDLVEKLTARVEASSDFSTVEEYVNYILEEVIKQTEGEESAFSSEEEKEVKDRLHDLGYLD